MYGCTVSPHIGTTLNTIIRITHIHHVATAFIRHYRAVADMVCAHVWEIELGPFSLDRRDIEHHVFERVFDMCRPTVDILDQCASTLLTIIWENVIIHYRIFEVEPPIIDRVLNKETISLGIGDSHALLIVIIGLFVGPCVHEVA